MDSTLIVEGGSSRATLGFTECWAVETLDHIDDMLINKNIQIHNLKIFTDEAMSTPNGTFYCLVETTVSAVDACEFPYMRFYR